MLASDRKYPVVKNALLHKLRENRGAHLQHYNDALEEYRKAFIDVVTLRIDDFSAARARARDLEPFEWPKNAAPVPVKPESYVSDYDRAIGLLEMTISEQIEITGDDYRCFVEDEWEWKERFRSTTMSYNDKNLVGGKRG